MVAATVNRVDQCRSRGDFMTNARTRVESNGYSADEARQFVCDLFQVDWYAQNEYEHALAAALLGLDVEGIDTFNAEHRLQDGLQALLNHRYVDFNTANHAARVYWENVPSPNVSAVVPRIIGEVFLVNPATEAGFRLQAAYWEAHGCGYDPRTLLPYIEPDSAVHTAVKKSLATVSGRYTLPQPAEYAAPLEVAITHDILTEVLFSTTHSESAVDDAFIGWLAEMTDILKNGSVDDVRKLAVTTFWNEFGIYVDDDCYPIFPDE